MRSIIFANYHAKDTGKLAFTMEVQNSKVKFLGNLYLNLWDCGGYTSKLTVGVDRTFLWNSTLARFVIPYLRTLQF